MGIPGVIFSSSGVFSPWSISPTHTHRYILGASRFTVGLCHVSPCLPRFMLCLDVNEVNPGPDREVRHTRLRKVD